MNSVNDLFVNPICKLKNTIDIKILRSGLLTEAQLNLVYQIIGAVAFGITLLLLPPLVGNLIVIGVGITHWLQPQLLSERTWAMLYLGSGGFILASTPSAICHAIKCDSIVRTIFMIARAGVGLIMTLVSIDMMSEQHNQQKINASLFGSDSDEQFRAGSPLDENFRK